MTRAPHTTASSLLPSDLAWQQATCRGCDNDCCRTPHPRYDRHPGTSRELSSPAIHVPPPARQVAPVFAMTGKPLTPPDGLRYGQVGSIGSTSYNSKDSAYAG